MELMELFLLGMFLGEVALEDTRLNLVWAASEPALLYFEIGEEEGEEEGESEKW